jgi:Type VII secretion system ESX-1, transport TM domain B
VYSHRDLAAAQAFHRRRLVAAFVSVCTNERHHEPPRTVRSVVAGMLVAAVCATGVVVTGVVCGHPQVSWVHRGVRISP